MADELLGRRQREQRQRNRSSASRPKPTTHTSSIHPSQPYRFDAVSITVVASQSPRQLNIARCASVINGTPLPVGFDSPSTLPLLVGREPPPKLHLDALPLHPSHPSAPPPTPTPAATARPPPPSSPTPMLPPPVLPFTRLTIDTNNNTAGSRYQRVGSLDSPVDVKAADREGGGDNDNVVAPLSPLVPLSPGGAGIIEQLKHVFDQAHSGTYNLLLSLLFAINQLSPRFTAFHRGNLANGEEQLQSLPCHVSLPGVHRCECPCSGTTRTATITSTRQ